MNFDALTVSSCQLAARHSKWWFTGLPVYPPGYVLKLPTQDVDAAIRAPHRRMPSKCPSTLSVKVPGQSASGLGVTRRTTPPPRRAAERAPFIVAQLTGMAAAVIVGNWLWAGGADGCRDGNEAASLAGHDRIDVTHAEPDPLRPEPVYVVNLGADRRVAGPDNQKDACLPRLQLLCPQPISRAGLVGDVLDSQHRISGKTPDPLTDSAIQQSNHPVAGGHPVKT